MRCKVQTDNGERESRSIHGLTRTLVANMVEGVTKGFEKSLEISGVGYRAELEGDVPRPEPGLLAPGRVELPQGVTAQRREADQGHPAVGPTSELVGRGGREIRGLKPPEPYKGKGISYSTETIRRKVGKAGGQVMR